MRVFIGMETSGSTRRAFALMGHDVISCDLLPAQDDVSLGRHFVGDVFETLVMLAAIGWRPDLALFHPDCTYLTGSAAWAFNDPDFVRYPGIGYHQRLKPGTLTGAARRKARLEAVEVVKRIWSLDIPKLIIENPVGSLSSMWMKPTQIIQPFQFGHDASKKTCLWSRGVPLLKSTKRFYGRFVVVNGKLIERFANQTDNGQNNLPPDDARWQDRADTYNGISIAMACQYLRIAC